MIDTSDADELRFRTLFQHFPTPTYAWTWTGSDLVLSAYNAAAETFTRGTIQRLIGKTARELYADQPNVYDDMLRCFQEKTTVRREISYTLRSLEIAKELICTYVFVPPNQVMIHTEDVTDRKQLEEQLLQSQKIESVGRLAGGIAHDFNNMLTAILSFTDLLALRLGRRNEEIDGIQQTTQRAAAMVRQLLGFARKQNALPKVVNINALVIRMHTMLLRLLGDQIEIRCDFCSSSPSARIDPAQFEQVLLNLAVNARDAMPRGGVLSLTTESVALDECAARQFGEIEPGEYVRLSVGDTGPGIPDAVRRHLFEPYFTTKPMGDGTGLGLATSYGIVKQNRGHIWAESEPGKGSVFRVILPTVSAAPAPDATPEELPLHVGTERVLLVEDEPSVRHSTTSVLTRAGFDVIEAQNGEDALEKLATWNRPPEILITDVSMPRMNGLDLATHLRARHAHLPVLFVSGYAKDEHAPEDFSRGLAHFLPKPYSPAELLHAVRGLLDAPDARTNSEAN
jgi:signal transduction histidine kinase/ActR/RegA family two-component response regulator